MGDPKLNTLVMGELAYLFNSRCILEPVFNRASLLGNRAVLIAVDVLVIVQGLFTYAPPLQSLFGTGAPGWSKWGRILAFGVVLFILEELVKALLRRREQQTL